MKKKKILWTVAILFCLTLIILLSWVLLADARYHLASQYRLGSTSSDLHENVLSLEKANFLFSSQENSIALAQAYSGVGKTERAIKILEKWKTLDGYNELGNLFLKQGEYSKASEAFESANSISENQISLQGWLEAEMREGESDQAKLLAEQLSLKFVEPENYCLAALFFLGTEPKKAFELYVKAKKCTAASEIDTFFKVHNSSQNSQFLRLEGASLHFHLKYFRLALNEVLALQNENNQYRDAFVLGYQIYKNLENDTEATKQKDVILKLDPQYDIH